MLYRKFGKTGEMVSNLGFGCMRLPVVDRNQSKIDEDQAIKIIRYAVDNGVNYIDTAYPYHGGQSEPFVAKALRDGYRQQVKIATKLPSWLINKREDMDRYLNEQLKRLETDSIDFYLIHALNKSYWYRLESLGVKEFLDGALKSGKIKHAGFSFHDDVVTFKRIVDSYDWSFCQIQYNYLDVNYQAGREGLEYAAERGLGIVIMEPLRGGKLVTKVPPEIKSAWREVSEERTPAEWALKWLWNHKDISIVLSGMTLMEHVQENLKIASSTEINSLSKEEEGVMKFSQKIFREKMKVDCTACGYCMPCPVGVNIPENFALYNDAFIFDDRESASRMYSAFLSDKERAGNCVQCGKCERRCPQNISVREELKKVQRLLLGEINSKTT